MEQKWHCPLILLFVTQIYTQRWKMGRWTELEKPICHCKSYIYSNTSILLYPSIKYIMLVSRVLLISIHITQALRLCVAPALNTAWQSTLRIFIHISGFTYNFMYNYPRLNLRNHDATASHLYIALSMHLIHQNCHQGAQNQHKQLPSHSYISTPQCCIGPVSYYTMTVTRMFFTGSLATFFCLDAWIKSDLSESK